jgi:hypothetical protein
MMNDNLIADRELRVSSHFSLPPTDYTLPIYVHIGILVYYAMKRRFAAPGHAGRKRSQIDTRIESIVRFARICRQALLSHECVLCVVPHSPLRLKYPLYACLLYRAAETCLHFVVSILVSYIFQYNSIYLGNDIWNIIIQT